MIERFTLDTFAGRVGEAFGIESADGVRVEAELIEALEAPVGDPERWKKESGRMPFSLVFLTQQGPVIPQQICRLRHAELGRFELFLVPLGPDRSRGGMRYEAVFG